MHARQRPCGASLCRNILPWCSGSPGCTRGCRPITKDLLSGLRGAHLHVPRRPQDGQHREGLPQRAGLPLVEAEGEPDGQDVCAGGVGARLDQVQQHEIARHHERAPVVQEERDALRRGSLGERQAVRVLAVEGVQHAAQVAAPQHGDPHVGGGGVDPWEQVRRGAGPEGVVRVVRVSWDEVAEGGGGAGSYGLRTQRRGGDGTG